MAHPAGLAASIAPAGDLTFIGDVVNPWNGKIDRTYIDPSTLHGEGAYETVKRVSIDEKPITAAGFAGVKSMVNTFQMDGRLEVKRFIYIGFLDTEGRVLIEAKHPNAPDEPFGVETADQKIKPYLCVHLADPVR